MGGGTAGGGPRSAVGCPHTERRRWALRRNGTPRAHATLLRAGGRVARACSPVAMLRENSPTRYESPDVLYSACSTDALDERKVAPGDGGGGTEAHCPNAPALLVRRAGMGGFGAGGPTCRAGGGGGCRPQRLRLKMIPTSR